MPARTVMSTLKKVAKFNGEGGTCWDDPSNLERLNDVRELIYERGDYTGTVEWGIYKSDCGVITLPIEVEDVRGIYACKSNTKLQSEFYEFVDKATAGGLATIRGHVIPLIFRKEAVKSPLFKIPLKPFLVRIDNEDGADDGKELIFEVRTGDIRKKHKVILNSEEEVTLDGNVNEVLSVIKPITSGDIQVFIDEGDGWVAAGFYPSWSENPRYTRLRSINCPTTSLCKQVVAFSKKKCRQLTDYSDMVEIESSQAIKFGYLAFNAQNTPAEYAANIQLMQNALEKADANLTTSEPSEAINPRYDTLVGP